MRNKPESILQIIDGDPVGIALRRFKRDRKVTEGDIEEGLGNG